MLIILMAKEKTMGVNNSVFPSKPEKKYFDHLTEKWGLKCKIYSNLPFLTVFNIDDLCDLSKQPPNKKMKLSKRDIERLKKTSIDYTMCDFDDKPMICIEFDGIQQGMNVGSKYVTKKESNNWRKTIMNLKLKIAHSSLFPFFVMQSNHFEVINKDDKLAIVDCVIGSILSNKEMTERFENGFDPQEFGMNDDEFYSLNKIERDAFLEYWATGIDVECSLKHNPIHEITYQLKEKLGVKKLGYGPIEPPELKNISNVLERAKIIDEIYTLGYRAWIELPDGRRFDSKIWVPDFRTADCTPYAYIDDLAVYLALKKLKKILFEKRE